MENLTVQELTAKLYELIEQNVSDGFERLYMYDIVDELETRVSN